MEFAGAQFAAWRKQNGVTQRQLMSEGLISHVSLRHFEQGRSWPRERMRAKLEERLGLPPGQILQWREGVCAAEPDPQDVGGIAVIGPALEVAVRRLASAVDDLPASSNAGYWSAATVVLRDLQTIDGAVAAAVRMSPSDAMTALLLSVRGLHDDLVQRILIQLRE